MSDAQGDAQNPFAPPDSAPGAPVPPAVASSPVGSPPSFPPPTGDPIGGPGWAASSPAAYGYSPYAVPSTPPKPRRRGVAWAIGGGIAAGVLLLNAAGYSAYTMLDDAITEASRRDAGPHSSGDQVWVSELTQGDCYILDEGDRRDLTAGEVTIIDCQFAHDGEVYGVGTLDFTKYPGARAVSDAAEKLCADHETVLDPAVYDADGLTGSWYSPLEEDWAVGPHSVECVVEADDALGLRRSWIVGGASASPQKV
jgi:hypothetical protein